MKLVTLFTLAAPILVSSRTMLPKDNKKAWQSKIKKEVHGFNWDIYANGKGRYEKPGKFKCADKWKNAVTYGARGKEITEFCVRLHENEHDKEHFNRSPSVYSNASTIGGFQHYMFSGCILDPNDHGNDHGKKDRDWLCYEGVPRYVLLPPHGIDLFSNCSDLENYAPRWYPKESPPEWCTYNWYADYQTCWCMKGFYRTSPHDTSLHMRACPSDTIIMKPEAMGAWKWMQAKHPVTAPTTKTIPTTTSTSTSTTTTASTTSTSQTSSTMVMTTAASTIGVITNSKETMATTISSTTISSTTLGQISTKEQTTATSTTIGSTIISTTTVGTSKRCTCPSPTSNYFESTTTIIQTTSNASITTALPTVVATTSLEGSPSSTSTINNMTSGYTAGPDGRNERIGVPTDSPNNTDCGEHGIWSSITQSCICHDGWETVGLEPCNTLSTSDDGEGFGELASNDNESSGSGGIIIAIVLVVLVVAIACYLMWRFYKHRSFSLPAIRLPTLSKPRRLAERELS